MFRFTLLIAILALLSVGTKGQGVAGDLLGRTNSLRAQRGLSAYTLNSQLTAAAANHAHWMVETGRISHVQDNGSSPRSRARANGYSSDWVSENIYMGTNAGTGTAWNFWINSPIHYAGLTSPNYAHVGIASASSNDMSAYVMVFGNPGGPTRSISQALTNSGATGGGAAAANAPSYVVGLDSTGNIMHEIQPGHTLGDIALIYGYTWDDLPGFLELNGMTWEDSRVLPIGGVFLVPPKSGTYTPSPQPSATPQPTEPASATPLPSATPPPPTLTATMASLVSEPTSTLPVEELVEPQTFQINLMPVATSIPATVIPATVPPTIPPTLTPLPSPLPPTATADASPQPVGNLAVVSARGLSFGNGTSIPFWLIGAILFQISILGIATAQFVRRWFNDEEF